MPCLRVLVCELIKETASCAQTADTPASGFHIYLPKNHPVGVHYLKAVFTVLDVPENITR